MQQLFGLFAQSSAKGARSTALQPALWILGLTGAGTIGSSVNGPHWIPIVFGIAFGVTFVLACFAYCYLLVNDRDSLRSESFSIEKLRIEKGIRGDTLAGFSSDTGQKILPSKVGEQ